MRIERTKQHRRKEKGFTFIELLVVMVLVILVGSIIGGVVIGIFRGSAKSNIIAQVQSNGDYALSQMAKELRNAKSFDGVILGDFTDEGKEQEGESTELRNTCMAVPSQRDAKYRYVQVTRQDNTPVRLSCCKQNHTVGYFLDRNSTCNPDNTGFTDYIETQTVRTYTSIDPDSQKQTEQCYFQCVQKTTAVPPIITIHLQLQSTKVNASEKALAYPLLFLTSVSLRNF